MHVEERPFAKDGLKAGDIVTCDLRVGTITVIRPKTPGNDFGGLLVLQWGSGDSSIFVSSIVDKSSFEDFVCALAQTHGCRIAPEHQTEKKLAFRLVAGYTADRD